MSNAQKRAYEQLLDRYGLAYSPPALDFTVAFGRAAPIILEIGCGMGETTVAIAQANPDNNYLGIEVHSPGVGSLLKLIEEKQLANIRIIQHDAVDVAEQMIPPKSLAGIHIFFPDPWPKKRHVALLEDMPGFGRALGDPRRVDGAAQAVRRVGDDVFVHPLRVLGMHLEESLRRRAGQCGALLGEAHRALVEDEHVAGEYVAPPRLQDAHAEVVFLAVPASEAPGIERSELGDGVPADIHAEADRGRQVHRAPRVGGCEEAVKRCESERSRQHAAPPLEGIGADGGVVREGRHRCDVGGAMRAGVKPVEPVVGDFGVAVEQHHVAVGMQGHPEVDRPDEAQVLRVAHQGDPSAARELVQILRDRGLGARVVDHHHLVGRTLALAQHAVDAGARLRGPLVDGDDDVDQALALRPKRRRAMPPRPSRLSTRTKRRRSDLPALGENISSNRRPAIESGMPALPGPGA